MSCNSGKKVCFQYGFTLTELVITLSISSIMLAIAGAQLKQYDDPVANAVAETVAFIKLTRARAISTTSAYTLSPVGNSRIIARHSDDCSSTLDNTDNLTLDFPTGAFMSDTTWTLCFTPRGLTQTNLDLEVTGNNSTVKNIEIYLGGAVREI